MATIQKRTNAAGVTSFRVQIRLKGLPPQTATFPRLTDAKHWAQQTEADLRSGRVQLRPELEKHTLKQLIERYKEEILPSKPASVDAQGPQLDWWLKQLGDCDLDRILAPKLSEIKAKLARTPTRQSKKRSNGSVNRYLAALSHVFTVAVKEWHWMDENPMRKVSRLREPRGRVRFLSDDERRKLLESCRSVRSPALFPIVSLAIYTGMRQGEIRRLRWNDIDFERGSCWRRRRMASAGASRCRSRRSSL